MRTVKTAAPAAHRRLLGALLAWVLVCPACTDTRGPGVVAPATTVTVFLPGVSPDNPLLVSIDYAIACQSVTSTSVTGTIDPEPDLEGTFDFAAGFESSLGRSSAWKAFVDFPTESDCIVELRARDADDEVLCTQRDSLRTHTEVSDDLYLEMVCGGGPFPALGLGGVRLTVETNSPAASSGPQGVGYLLDCAGFSDMFLENAQAEFGRVTVEGFMVPGGPGLGAASSGGGPTQLWTATVAEVPEGPCVLDTTLLGDADEPLCTNNVVFQSVTGIDTDVHVLLTCAE